MMEVPPLDAFLLAAGSGEYVEVCEGQDGLAVVAVGRAPDGRRVAWVDPSRPGALPSGMANAAAAFLMAIENSYGSRIAGIVRRELALPDEAGAPLPTPLPAPLVRRAVEIARASQNLYSGMNFMSRLHLSAKRGGAEFEAACRAADLRPGDLGPGRRACADYLFDRAFETAARANTVHVDMDDARRLFVDALRQVSGMGEDAAARLCADTGSA